MTLSIGGGFLGAKAAFILDFFAPLTGGAGKSAELDSAGYAEEADGADPRVFPALSFFAWACAAAYGLELCAAALLLALLPPPPREGKLSELLTFGAARDDDDEVG